MPLSYSTERAAKNETSIQVLRMKATLLPLRSNELFGCPLIETMQRALTTLPETIQRARRRLKDTTQRGGATCKRNMQLN